MLDLKTVLLVELSVTALQGIVWFFVWLVWRRLYELKFIAAGFICIAAGIALLISRGAAPPGWHIVLDNAIIKLGVVLMADGLARFLGQPRHAWLGISVLIFQLVFWSVAVTVAPGDVVLRIHAQTLTMLVVMGFMALTLARDRSQPRLLRWITIGLLLEYMAASVAQSVLEMAAPSAGELSVLSNRNAWFFFQGTLFLIAFFACMLFMVSTRLSADLRARNETLAAEIAERRRLEAQLSESLATEKRLHEEQRQFVRMVSHEFRTPLGAIQLATETIGMILGEPPEAIARRLAGIGEAVHRMAGLIDRFLAADREDGKVLQVEPLEMAALVAEVE
ncbi:sensor histidine kinase, partial [Tistlia consotensis]